MDQRTATDAFTATVVRNYLFSTVQEMYETTVRSAYSTCISEAQDFTCSLFDDSGRMIVQSLGLPAHTGGLADTMRAITEAFDDFAEGDVILHNDPYAGGTHQADVTVCRPVFVDGVRLGFAINRGHWVDVGGMAAGGWSGTARHVVQEALLIPPVKLYRGGVLSREIRDFVLRNIRLSAQCWGDIQAQIASNIVAERRIRWLAAKYGLNAILDAMEGCLDYSRRRFFEAARAIPNGTWHGEETMDDDGDGNGPYHIRVAVTRTPEKFIVDFEGTDPQVAGAVNLTLAGTQSAAFTAVIAVVDPQVPLNAGLMGLIEVRAPRGCLVNPVYPAPVFSWGDPMNRAYEAVLKALGEVVPERIMAGTHCSGNNLTGSGQTGDDDAEFVWYHFGAGGCGARASKDGNTIEWLTMHNAKRESMEIWETRNPVQIEGERLIEDSGGAGKYRGGLGAERRIRLLVDTRITSCADRHISPPWGWKGGKDGLANHYWITRGGVTSDVPTLCGVKSPSKFDNVPLLKDDVLAVIYGGGGGYGDPLDRDPEKVASDVADGYVSARSAREDYGVSIDPVSGKVDALRTAELRAGMRAR